ncbi:MAG: RES family NAD+ phosphorylase [Actinomycetota bacterium]|nr:RES family NAD+ phosphorylase [Actinomycetota bacterium]
MSHVSDQIDRVNALTVPTITDGDLTPAPADLWRIRFVDSPHPLAWNELRTFGPVNGCRFDPQDPPPGDDVGNGVSYLGSSLETAVLEVFHQQRRIDRETMTPVVYRLQLRSRPLLLDLRSGWPSRLGIYQEVSRLVYPASQLLARRIRAANPNVPGLLFHSARSGHGLNIVLWQPAAAELHTAVLVESAPLADPRWNTEVAGIANRHGFV